MAVQRGNGTRRVWVPAAFMGAFALVVFARLIQLQVIEHHAYAQAARDELSASNTIYAHRGTILDRNGDVLATSVDTWDIYVSSRAWAEPGRAKAASEQLGAILGVEPAALRETVAGAGSIDVLVARDLEFGLGNDLQNAGIPGVSRRPNTARINPEGDTGASILGLIGQDNTGLAGIEAAYNDLLQGQPGKAIYERDTTGEPIPFGNHVAVEPEPGSDVVLTIDRHLQALCEDYLAKAIEKHEAKKGGVIIMMDPGTGEILCLATDPRLQYSALDSIDFGDPDQLALLKNRAVTDLYEPGSRRSPRRRGHRRGVDSPDTIC
jgi:cell division protein FtsI/penicillin-binding protein 2